MIDIQHTICRRLLPLLLLARAVAFPVAAHAGTALTAAGATFPYPIYSKWFSEYHKLHPEVQINYQSIGSGGGIKQVTDGTVDFGASDGPMNDQQLAEFSAKHAGNRLLHFPTVLGAAVPTYNIPGVSAAIKFTPAALAGIFLGKVVKWNDPALAQVNAGVALPDKNIIVVHRSDGSGTTYIWADYLSKVSPEWQSKVGVGTSVNWPVGLGAKGNEGVTGLVRQTPYAIGYVELIYALQNKLGYGLVQNGAGEFVRADLHAVTAAAAAAATSMPDDFRVSITNAPGGGAYPISSFTWLLIPAHVSDAGKRSAITGFLQWMLHDGQKFTEALSYAPLPAPVVAKEERALKLVQP